MKPENTAVSPVTMLICTVGGSPEPIVAALKHWRPARVQFVPTRQTEQQVVTNILPLAEREGIPLSPGCYEICSLPDGQDFAACIDTLRRLNGEVEHWLARGEDFRVVVDFTGGTKCMSAAIAVQSHRWRCLFAYVGGSERTKNGVGVVVSGTESIVHSENPWEVLGYQAVEEAMTLFDEGAYSASSRLLDRAIRNVVDDARKRQLNALKLLAEGYDAWDRFDHKTADNSLGKVAKSANDLKALLENDTRTDSLLGVLRQHRDHLSTLDVSQGPTPQLVKDLLANARRRAREGRFDDAVARLYRAIEAIAQTQLRQAHGIADTGCVALERVPESLQAEWAPRAREGKVKVALQDAFVLLRQLGDPVGHRFHDLKLDQWERSPLVARNASILAHGFQPVSDKVFSQLWEAAMSLAELATDALPQFPRLATTIRNGL